MCNMHAHHTSRRGEEAQMGTEKELLFFLVLSKNINCFINVKYKYFQIKSLIKVDLFFNRIYKSHEA